MIHSDVVIVSETLIALVLQHALDEGVEDEALHFKR